MARPRKNRQPIPPPPVCRAGKIDRLPSAVRDELCRRMRDGERDKELIAWLNSLPDVQARLALYFGGRPVTSANMSHWRAGGYAEWFSRLPQPLASIMNRIASLN